MKKHIIPFIILLYLSLVIETGFGQSNFEVYFTNPINGAWVIGGSTITVTYYYTSPPFSSGAQFDIFLDGTVKAFNLHGLSKWDWYTPTDTVPHSLKIEGTASNDIGSGGYYSEQTITVYIDNEVPSVSLVSPSSGNWYDGNASIPITVTGTDNSSGVGQILIYANTTNICTLSPSPSPSPGGPKSYNGTYNWQPNTSGTYNLSAIIYDRANRSSTSSTSTIYVDLNNPQVTITSPSHNSWQKGNITIPITVSGSDTGGSGVKNIDLFVDGNPSCTFYSSSGSCNWTIPNNSTQHVLEAKIYDKVGRNSTARNVVNVDANPPVITSPPVVANSQNGFSTTTSLTWSWSAASDNQSIKEYKILIEEYGNPNPIINWQSCGTNTTYIYSVAQDGKTYLCSYKAIDQVGNEATSTKTTIKVDASVSPVSLPPYPLHYNSGSATIFWNPITSDFSGIKGYEVALTQTAVPPVNGIEVTKPDCNNSWNYTFSGLSALNTYYAWVRGVDILANKGEWTSTSFLPFKVDGPGAGLITNNNQFTFTLTNCYPLSGKEFRFKIFYRISGGTVYDSGLYTKEPVTITLPFPSDGTWQWWAEVIEYANGVEIQESKQIIEPTTFSVDQTPPNICTFSIKSPDGAKEYSVSSPANSRDVLLTDIGLSDGLGTYQSGIKGIYLWNGDETTPPADAVYLSQENIPPSGILWQLGDGDGIWKVNMLAEDTAGNTAITSREVMLDRILPGKPQNISRSLLNDKIVFHWQAGPPEEDSYQFKGIVQLAGESAISFTVEPSASKTGTVEVDIRTLGSDLPVTITVYAVDKAGNMSECVSYVAYTKAALGELVFDGGSYDTVKDRIVLNWHLTENSPALWRFLLYGEMTSQGFIGKGYVIADPSGAFIQEAFGNPENKLQPHALYYYRLCAVNHSGDFNYGQIFSQEVPNNAPSKPVIISPTEFAGNEVEFKYNQARDYDCDELVYSIWLGEGTEPGQFTELPGNSASNLKNGQIYSWYVKVVDGFGGVTTSDVAHFTADTTAPELEPEEIKRPFTNADSFKFIIRDNVSGVDKVEYKKIDAVSNALLAEGTVGLTANPDGGWAGSLTLEEGRYHIHLIGWDKAGNQTLVELNNLGVDRTQPLISDVQLNLPKENDLYLSERETIPVSWTATDNLSGIACINYRIYELIPYNILGNTFYIQITRLMKGIKLSSNFEHYSYFLNTGALNGKQYYLAISTFDKAGNGSPTQTIGPILIDSSEPRISISLSGPSLKLFGSAYYFSDLSTLNVNVNAVDDETAIRDIKYALMDVSSGTLITLWSDWSDIKQTSLTPGKKYQIKVKARNTVYLEKKVSSNELIYDNTAPANLTLNSDSTTCTSHQVVLFNANAVEPDSVITEYRFAIGSGQGQHDISDLIPGNENGWISIHSNKEQAAFRLELPEIADGQYFLSLEVENAAGLKASLTNKTIQVNNNQEQVFVNDEGPYTSHNDRLTGRWRYAGSRAIAGYRYRLLNNQAQVIRDWNVSDKNEETSGQLSLTDGTLYRFEVQASYPDGSYSNSAFSPGVMVDTTKPGVETFVTPEFVTSAGIKFSWEGKDPESEIAVAQVALGSNFGEKDITGGWVNVQEGETTLSYDYAQNKLPLTTGTRYYLTLRLINGAGLITEVYSQGITIDDSPPPRPIVYDQGDYINNKQLLEANWMWSPTDPESGVHYKWALITSIDELASANWIEGDETKRIRLTDLLQVHGKTYYFAVLATNGAGLSSIGISDGIMVDATAPYIPEVRLLDAINLGNPDAQELNYITSNEALGLWVDSADPESPVDGYLYAWGNRDTVDITPRNTAVNENIVLDNPAIPEGKVTFFAGECTNKAELVSTTGYSAGVILDTGAPKINNVHAAFLNNKLFFDWDVVPSASPVVAYEIALVNDELVNANPASWLKIGLTKKASFDGSSIEDGRYRLLIRGMNAAGNYSRREGDINEWGISTCVTVDRTPPQIIIQDCPRYADKQLTVKVTATDSLSGIHSYQYACGLKADPGLFSNGWIDIVSQEQMQDINISVENIAHRKECYVWVRVKDKSGNWSMSAESNRIIIDHTAPTLPVVQSDPFATSLEEIKNIHFNSTDPESGITHYKLGVVPVGGGEWQGTVLTGIEEFKDQLTGINLTEAGLYKVAVQTLNAAGLWSDTGYSEPFKVDTLKPVLTFSRAGEELVINKPPLDIEYNLSEKSKVHFILTGTDGSVKTSELLAESGKHLFNFTEEKVQIYRLAAYATDEADNRGESSEQRIRVNAFPQVALPPIMNISVGAPITLSATVHDPDGEVVWYEWQPGAVDGEALHEASPHYVYNEKGLYTLTLTVRDNDGGISTANTQVMVGNTTSGPLYVDEVWSGIHHIYADVFVPAGLKLTIMPGTQVIVDGLPGETGYFHALIIRGTLLARGENENTINFISITGKPDGWKGIYVEGKADLDYVVVSHAQRGLTVVETADVTIDNCNFTNNYLGIHVWKSQPTITNTLFKDNIWYAIKEDEGGKPIVKGCTFTGNKRNYYSDSSTSITIEELNNIPGNQDNRRQ